ncbi:glutaredoxin-like protein [Methanospirillum hungatei JF-1]|jgi:glutaredoxin|uniref:Glutaredoxin-like protein n=1 Tax=Methanospirillum hungatei JF-1 (strain ATCC 27890 / DSM 864 / NBRC 100397 / JF-1) TaxID=323259 RepID=Q2FTJ2_METHJ|nr:glutaredoxin [Methanospirillum hungatei]ABD42504.1 glutaredoxin-like protein [Methanospirillum hungatei JF-1]MBP9008500.1 glutaredoxin family protein [Methanospirillum sp.]HOW04647.1 glutaredoxin family protein [Methanospirillum hungatei]
MGAVFIVYTLEFCPRCEILKDFLTSHQIPFTVADMSSAKALTELRVNGIFVQEAPVLQVDKTFLTSQELFSGDAINEQRILQLC